MKEWYETKLQVPLNAIVRNFDPILMHDKDVVTACGICDRMMPLGCEGKFKDQDPFCLLNDLPADA